MGHFLIRTCPIRHTNECKFVCKFAVSRQLAHRGKREVELGLAPPRPDRTLSRPVRRLCCSTPTKSGMRPSNRSVFCFFLFFIGLVPLSACKQLTVSHPAPPTHSPPPLQASSACKQHPSLPCPPPPSPQAAEPHIWAAEGMNDWGVGAGRKRKVGSWPSIGSRAVSAVCNQTVCNS